MYVRIIARDGHLANYLSALSFAVARDNGQRRRVLSI